MLSLTQVRKTYHDFVAVDSVSLDVAEGEFVSFLGPSGSGKTTTLRMIAGFTEPDAGSVVLSGRELTRVPAFRRDIGMVFQHYALFPHMTVAENVAFSLKMRKVDRTAARRRVEAALERVQLAELGDRKPAQLSGGQQQRVALARAIVFEPKLLLMDEPLGALDKKLREALQVEITRISRELGMTVVYVTHDQDEALAMSDRIAIYNHGRIEQLGTGRDLYERPTSLFVATFMGDSNVLTGTLEKGEVSCPSGRIQVDRAHVAARSLRDGDRVSVVVRPEKLSVSTAAPERNRVKGTVAEVVYLGASQRVLVDVPGCTLTVRQPAAIADGGLRPGDVVQVGWPADHGVVVPAEASS
ncbi:ABC transporter ATP-binding protein [Streptomyces acidiscabies]|uniref:Spermidine/putrescine import ATP-binding protein PotA n=1 Tax=Streptomyces acidiscabies TaxID=42234 RepID=A0AAP6BBG5_9ACTN|nr:ABC transporter ATP-binding protein [Streptomyces acidiscabies]MBP5935051.1 ABC transporter ATP-binding protein [Streptomyces sp. LBUM 1476]MDX2961402.1 ABC transporter ATP-binding protein [Streptomyces acidiscabies]MDX3022760.1 ABC transporter ATP-binding protein [Streptomyces acidiscabies]MDX3792124.1 ABC transporter ATP-binding protein [Streptomyces acidiscabies]GAQ50979.1 spermidine/putrescine import ATP-binding protein [Streptomyces acidiscabies]